MGTGQTLEGYGTTFQPSVQQLEKVAAMQNRDVVVSQTMADDDPESGQSSFMVKKADKDLQEVHEKAKARPAVSGSGITGGGSVGGTAAAKTKDEIDAARKARLDRLEAAQNLKRKENEEAERKKKAQDALFKHSSSTGGLL